jgi:hypothetical protein
MKNLAYCSQVCYAIKVEISPRKQHTKQSPEKETTMPAKKVVSLDSLLKKAMAMVKKDIKQAIAQLDEQDIAILQVKKSKTYEKKLKFSESIILDMVIKKLGELIMKSKSKPTEFSGKEWEEAKELIAEEKYADFLRLAAIAEMTYNR